MRFDVKSVLSSMLFVVLFSLISTYVPPQYVGYVFIAYFVVILIAMTVIPKIRSKKVSTQIAMSGSVLMKVSQQEVLSIASRDVELSKEMKQMMTRFLLFTFVPLLLWFSLFQILRSVIIPGIEIDKLELFVRYLAFYGIVIASMYALRYALMPRKMIIAVMSYEVRRGGIVGVNPSISIPFPLDRNRYTVHYDLRRGFVEIFDRKSRQALRFYASDPAKLKDIIERYGLMPGEASEHRNAVDRNVH